VRRCVISINLKNEEAMARVGSQRHKKKNRELGKWLHTNSQKIDILIVLGVPPLSLQINIGTVSQIRPHPLPHPFQCISHRSTLNNPSGSHHR